MRTTNTQQKFKLWQDCEWSTHLPLLETLLGEYNFSRIVEIGMGIHSTPLILQSKAEQLIFIENDHQWISKLRSSLTFDSRSRVFHQSHEGLNQYSDPADVADSVRDLLRTEYVAIAAGAEYPFKSPTLLFVDNYRPFRAIAIEALYPLFDIIVYHDCQPAGIPYYNYFFSTALYKQALQYFLTTPTSWTGIFIKRKCAKQIDGNFASSLQKNIEAYCALVGTSPNDVRFISYVDPLKGNL
jgi:hypothetical protein